MMPRAIHWQRLDSLYPGGKQMVRNNASCQIESLKTWRYLTVIAMAFH